MHLPVQIPHPWLTPHPRTAYYLGCGAFWFSQIFVTLVEQWRSDFWVMMIHHVITTILIFSSWQVNNIRVGVAILVEQDLADIFLPLAKCFKYLGLPTIGDIWFAIFAVIWYPTRHFLFFLIYYSILTQCPITDYDPDKGVFLSYNVWVVYVVLLGGFQVRRGTIGGRRGKKKRVCCVLFGCNHILRHHPCALCVRCICSPPSRPRTSSLTRIAPHPPVFQLSLRPLSPDPFSRPPPCPDGSS